MVYILWDARGSIASRISLNNKLGTTYKLGVVQCLQIIYVYVYISTPVFAFSLLLSVY